MTGLPIETQGFVSVWHEKSARCRLLHDPTSPQRNELQFNYHFDLSEDAGARREVSEEDFLFFHHNSRTIAGKFFAE